MYADLLEYVFIWFSSEFSLSTQCKGIFSVMSFRNLSAQFFNLRGVLTLVSCPIFSVAYAENFHGVFGSGSHGGHLYLVCAVCDVTI